MHGIDVASSQLPLGVPLLEYVGMVFRLERDAWSMVEGLKTRIVITVQRINTACIGLLKHTLHMMECFVVACTAYGRTFARQ